jgi:hypothetical protein
MSVWPLHPNGLPAYVASKWLCCHEVWQPLLRAELLASLACAYGLTRDELHYTHGPADVLGPDFPGQTFRVLKKKDLATFGEYRTRRLVLEAWDKLPPL